MNFQGLYNYPFSTFTTENGTSFACDVISGTLRRIYGNSHAIVCQNLCRMQGRCVVGGCSNIGCVGKGIPLHSIPLSQWKLDQKREKDQLQKSGMINQCKMHDGTCPCNK